MYYSDFKNYTLEALQKEFDNGMISFIDWKDRRIYSNIPF